MTKNKQIEREEVLIPCLNLCKKLKKKGYILKYRRLDALDCYHELGDPDIEIWVTADRWLYILMIECKKPIGGRLSKSQILFKRKYGSYKNTIYAVTTNVIELEKTIMSFDSIHFNQEKFKEMQSWDQTEL